MIRNNNYIEVSSPPYTLNDSTMIQLGLAEMSDNEKQNTNKESKTNTDAYDIDEVMEDVGYPIIGTIGGSMISISLLPQVIKTYKTKSAEDFRYVSINLHNWYNSC